MFNINNKIHEINSISKISSRESFSLAQICSKLLRSDTEKQNGRKIIISILENWDKLNSDDHELWTDIIEAAGFYPYLNKEKNKLVLRSISGKIRKEFHKSNNTDKYFHEEQLILKRIIDCGKNLIVSAPTSFGKSLLIEEIVAGCQFNNIVIIQPTLALLDETRNKLNKYRDNYKIIVRTSQPPSNDRGNLFLLTAERVMEYNNLPKIDFLIVDEFYKLSAKRDDERADVLNAATNLLLNIHKSRFYMLGPNIENISAGFAEKFNAEFYKTDYSLVDNQSVDIFSEHLGEFGPKGEKKLYKEFVLFQLLLELKNEQTLIYCSSPQRARYLSKQFVKFLIENEILPFQRKLSIVEWIKLNVSPNWILIKCLEYGIGFHDGALQKHITTTIIEYFNELKLNFLFCTSTIIEGVNTSAKNVIYFDEKKGKATKDKTNKIDFFDYSNIKGRSGRMMVHYVGKIYNFNKPPEVERIIIDFPFFEQNPISNEILIQLDPNDILNTKSEQYDFIYNTLSNEERLLFKKTGDLVLGQKRILDNLELSIYENYRFINWVKYPTYEQLTFVLTLAWDNLMKSGETVNPMTLKQLIKVTNDYARSQSIFTLIESSYVFKKSKDHTTSSEDLYDEAIREAFQVLRHWFQYKVPKWLNVVNQIQIYVCQKHGLEPGNFSFYASQIENDFIRENLSILYEYGVPKTAIELIGGYIPPQISEDQVISLINSQKLYELDTLLPYEKEKLKSIL
ncbi:helicase [Paenibacillus odorifer]|nr:helicase [Paenibacillus odorifer]